GVGHADVGADEGPVLEIRGAEERPGDVELRERHGRRVWRRRRTGLDERQRTENRNQKLEKRRRTVTQSSQRRAEKVDPSTSARIRRGPSVGMTSFECDFRTPGWQKAPSLR